MNSTHHHQQDDGKVILAEFFVNGEIDGVPLDETNISIDDLVLFIVNIKTLVYGSEKPTPEIQKAFNLKISHGSLKATVRAAALAATFTLSQATPFATDIAAIIEGRIPNDPSRRKSLDRMTHWISDGSKKIKINLHQGQKGDVMTATITNQTQFTAPSDIGVWVYAETYLTAELTDIGGTDANIHLRVRDKDVIIATAKRDYLAGISENYIYKKIRVRLGYQYNTATAARRNYTLVEILGLKTPIDDQALDAAIAEGTKIWHDVVDHVAWVRGIRGAQS